jgi:hypothetical protein
VELIAGDLSARAVFEEPGIFNLRTLPAWEMTGSWSDGVIAGDFTFRLILLKRGRKFRLTNDSPSMKLSFHHKIINSILWN